MKHYHYIFAGAGLSSLMTVYEMMISEKFANKTILLIDIDAKKTNDRTWCFWEKEKGQFDAIVSKKWDNAIFANQKFSRDLDFNPYQYKMIRGFDFYNLVFDLIKKQNNITFVNEKIIRFNDNENQVVVISENQNYTCDTLFNSIYNPEIVKSQTKYPLLSQHFIGWFVKTKEAVFNPEQATFMDFSIEQKGNTRFMYVLPTSTTEALLEPTLFSHDLLKKEEYEAEILLYLKKLSVSDFEITEKEQGNIPMTCYPFWKHNTKNTINIGSAGGWTKASTGFTFKHTTKKAKKLVAFLQKDTDFRKFQKKDKFWFYDLLFLDVLDKNNELGSTVFSALFKNGNPNLVLKFLDHETSYWEDLQVMLKCPKLPFIKALIGRIFRF
ncbi:lycopene cyclase family protein [Flavobacterium sp.]|uniref:lycopene cyclase family protein n=1 Tax=Flavobacterium sp. TaxID=239 RepID=UPI00286E50D9|nr:lycopene cyclase family protein [Flavobacterium sp.]